MPTLRVEALDQRFSLLSLIKVILPTQVSPEHDQQIVKSSQSAAKIFIPERAKQFEDSWWFGFLRVSLDQSLRDRPG
jgi:hypothetical protein